MKPFDCVVIGGGSAGYASARTAHSLGLSTAVIEGGPEVGGLCILRGCMPTKTLLESAHRLHEMHRAKEFGLSASNPRPDLPAIIRRKNRLIREFADYRVGQLNDGRFTFVRGTAAFRDPHSVTVKLQDAQGRPTGRTRTIEAKTFILATGSVVSKVPVPGLEEAGYWTSDDAIHASRLPKSVAVLGGGVIAMEFAQYFAHLGVKVSIIQRSPRILKDHDDDLSDELTKVFRAEGVKVITGTTLREVRRQGKSRVVSFEHEGRVRRITVDRVLYALGRSPAIDGLNLPAAGVALDGERIGTDTAMRTSARHIFAAGDVCGPYEVVHTAIEQGEAAAHNAALLLRKTGKPARLDYRLHTEIIFTSPEIASVGLTEKEAKARKIPYLTAKYPFNDHGKSIVMGAIHGFVKLIASPTTGEILGAQIIGPHASDLIHEWIAVMYFRGTVRDFLKIPHYHPTLAEILTYPAEEIADQLPA